MYIDRLVRPNTQRPSPQGKLPQKAPAQLPKIEDMAPQPKPAPQPQQNQEKKDKKSKSKAPKFGLPPWKFLKYAIPTVLIAAFGDFSGIPFVGFLMLVPIILGIRAHRN